MAIGMIIAWAIAIGCIAWYATDVAKDVTYVTLADGRKQERALPLAFKLLLPFVGNFDNLLKRESFRQQVESADRMLISAGFEGVLSGREFVALKFMIPLVFGPLWSVTVLLLGAMATDSVLESNAPVVCLLGFGLFYIQPLMWLRKALRLRHSSIVKSLPFVLDILTLSVEAGMDFITALQRNCATRKMDPLNEELLRMTKEIQVGLSRREALRHMSERVNQPDLRSVANALIQADELGVSIGPILRIQSEQLRSRRFDRAEKMAHEAPTKMLGPLMLCIFPAVFIILLGPVIAQAVKGMF